jgi:hypothetical protein
MRPRERENPGSEARADSTTPIDKASPPPTAESGGLIGELVIGEPIDYNFAGAPSPMTRATARRITDHIKLNTELLWDAIVTAYRGRVWEVLGYASWNEYTTSEFGTTRLRLPREQRAEVVASLRESGLSLRAIESATGISRKTVIKDLNQVVESTPPAAEPIDAEVDEGTLAEELIAAAGTPGAPTESTPGQTSRVAEALDRARQPSRVEPPKVTGLDGKTYQPTPPHPRPDSRPRRRPITESFLDATWNIGKKTESLKRLADDDRFARNGQELAHQNLADLKRARQRLDEVIGELEGWWDR